MKNQTEIRNQNLSLVRNVFTHEETLVASQIAQKTGLSVVTVNAILDEMCKGGEMEKQGLSNSGNGRPSTLYRYNRQHHCGLVLFAYNSGDRIILNTLAVNLYGEVLNEVTESYAEIGETHILNAVEGCMRAFPRTGRLVLGLPGIERHGVVTSGDFASFIDTAFIERIEERFRLRIAFMNDINAAVYGHYKNSEAACENEAGVFFPTRFPPGAGIILSGALYLGDTGFAGEIAYLSGPAHWSDLYRAGEEEIAKQIYPIVRSIICVLNPGRVVLYGEYLTAGILELVQNEVRSVFPAAAVPEILLLHTFETDFKNGLIAFIKDKLWEGL